MQYASTHTINFDASLYVCVYIVFTIMAYYLSKIIFNKVNFSVRTVIPTQIFFKNSSSVWLGLSPFIVLLGLDLIANLQLIVQNTFFVANPEKINNMNFLAITKLFSNTHIILLFLIGRYIIQYNLPLSEYPSNHLFKNPTHARKIIYIVLFLYSVLLGFYSGSRFTTLLPFLIIFYNHYHFFKKHLLIWISLGIITASLLFPLLLFNRSHQQSITDSLSMTIDQGAINSLFSLPHDRLNSIYIVDTIMQKSDDTIKIDYFYNLIGVVPRFLWPEKPIIGIDLHQFALDFGLIGPNDPHTTIGMTPIGESYYELGYFGLIVAFFEGFILFMINKIFGNKSDPTSQTFYFFLAILFVLTGTYTYILPRFLQEFILIFIIISLFEFFYGNNHKNSSKHR